MRALLRLLGVLVLLAGSAAADPARLYWDAPVTVDPVLGYEVWWGTAPGVYTQRLAVADVTAEVTGLTPGTPYYFVVRAVYANNVISGNSNEVRVVLQVSTATITIVRVPPP